MAVLLIVCVFGVLSHQSVYAAEPIGKLVSVSGDLSVQNEKVKGESRVLAPGAPVYKGDVLKTAEDSSAKVLMADQSVLDLNPSTELKLEDYKPKDGANREISISVPLGKLRASVTQGLQGSGKFKIRTHSAVMGVRGTEFVVEDEGKTSLTVLHGKVEIGSPSDGAPKPEAVAAGQQVTAALGSDGTFKMSPPVNLTPAQLNAVAEGARVADRTFQNSIVVRSSTVKGNRSGRSPASDGRGGSGTTMSAALASSTESVRAGSEAIVDVDSVTNALLAQLTSHTVFGFSQGAPVSLALHFHRKK
jgi:hypothetical protein